LGKLRLFVAVTTEPFVYSLGIFSTSSATGPPAAAAAATAAPEEEEWEGGGCRVGLEERREPGRGGTSWGCIASLTWRSRIRQSLMVLSVGEGEREGGRGVMEYKIRL